MADAILMKKSPNRKPLPDRKRVKRLLKYNKTTGIFYWKKKRSGVIWNGGVSVAGCFGNDGYLRICIDGDFLLAHRLAFLIVTGECPDEVDHIDRNPANNRWRNLRPATRSQNAANIGTRSDNVSGRKGVHWSSSAKRWVAKIRVNGKQIHIGHFTDLEEASQAYQRAAEKHFGEYAGHVSGQARMAGKNSSKARPTVSP